MPFLCVGVFLNSFHLSALHFLAPPKNAAQSDSVARWKSILRSRSCLLIFFLVFCCILILASTCSAFNRRARPQRSWGYLGQHERQSGWLLFAYILDIRQVFPQRSQGAVGACISRYKPRPGSRKPPWRDVWVEPGRMSIVQVKGREEGKDSGKEDGICEGSERTQRLGKQKWIVQLLVVCDLGLPLPLTQCFVPKHFCLLTNHKTCHVSSLRLCFLPSMIAISTDNFLKWS